MGKEINSRLNMHRVFNTGRFVKIRSCYLSIKSYLISFFICMWELLCLSRFIVEGKRRRRFVTSAANEEIRALKRNNKKYRIYKYNPYVRCIDWIERHKIKATIVAVSLVIASYLLCARFPTWSLPKGRLGEIAEFQTFVATIQVTLFAVVVPFSVAILEFVFKDYHAKLELIRLVHKETKVLLVTGSSIILTIILFSTQYVGEVFEIPDNFAAVTITSVWFIINIIGMGYFIITGLQFLTPSYRYSAIAKFVANEVYPNEIKKYLRRNIYLNAVVRNKEEEHGGE